MFRMIMTLAQGDVCECPVGESNPVRVDRKDTEGRDAGRDAGRDSLSSIFVSTDNGVFTCKVSLRSTVASAKAAILQSCAGDRGHCDPSDVWLRSGCKALQDDSTLEQCGVCAGATVRLEVRVRGGGVCMGKPTVIQDTVQQQPEGPRVPVRREDMVQENIEATQLPVQSQQQQVLAAEEAKPAETAPAAERAKPAETAPNAEAAPPAKEVVAALQQQPEEDQRAISSGAGTAQRTSLRDIEEMSIRELNEELTALGGSAEGCVEKADIVARLLEARAVHLFPQQAVAQRHAKLCMDPRVLVRKGKLGGINLFDGRLEDHTGHADVNRLRGIFSEHCLSPDSDDEFTPPNNPELRCTPKRELDFVIGKDVMDLKTFEVKVDARPTYDASSLVNERNVQPIAELMKKKEAKRAGLHIAETVALRLYTGKKPIG